MSYLQIQDALSKIELPPLSEIPLDNEHRAMVMIAALQRRQGVFIEILRQITEFELQDIQAQVGFTLLLEKQPREDVVQLLKEQILKYEDVTFYHSLLIKLEPVVEAVGLDKLPHAKLCSFTNFMDYKYQGAMVMLHVQRPDVAMQLLQDFQALAVQKRTRSERELLKLALLELMFYGNTKVLLRSQVEPYSSFISSYSTSKPLQEFVVNPRVLESGDAALGQLALDYHLVHKVIRQVIPVYEALSVHQLSDMLQESEEKVWQALTNMQRISTYTGHSYEIQGQNLKFISIQKQSRPFQGNMQEYVDKLESQNVAILESKEYWMRTLHVTKSLKQET